MSTSTPIPPGSSFVVELTDPNDPEGPMELYMVDPSNEDNSVMLAGSFGAESDDHFFWLVQSAAAYHKLPVNDRTGRIN